MGKKEFKDYICRPFCKFFQEGHKEEMACRGAQVVELLLQQGRLKSEDLPIHKKGLCLWEKHDTFLEATVCNYCSFQAEGCDFQSTKKPPGSEPCGGYMLLCILKNKGTIAEVDLKETASE